jgi:hypothetical protein
VIEHASFTVRDAEVPEAIAWFAHIDKSLGIEHLEALATD